MAHEIKLIFPVHPRTMAKLEEYDLLSHLKLNRGLIITEPLNYIRFMSLVFAAKFILTDSGGIQEETSYLGIPCLTLRDNTERPVTISHGTNRLCNLDNILANIHDVLVNKYDKNPAPQYWDGETASRVVTSIKRFFKI